MAAERASLIWSPRSNIDLYGHTAQVVLARQSGVRIALGSDWTYSGSMNMLRELRCADELNTNYYNKRFDDADLWKMVTTNAALATGSEDAIGLLKVGMVADIAIFNGAVNKHPATKVAAQNHCTHDDGQMAASACCTYRKSSVMNGSDHDFY
jgi:cytosine/adenosine deaminase-related metal-dependent hydrolase